MMKTWLVVVAGAMAVLSGLAMAADIPAGNGFDYYLLSTQWVPGWCQTGTAGKSGATLDPSQACGEKVAPLMFHGLWPERSDGSYPHDCHAVPPLDSTRLTFANPYRPYLKNAVEFVDHEWSKHATCTPFYQPGSEQSDAAGYYQRVNRYFGDAIAAYQKITVPALAAQSTVDAIKQRFAERNPQYPAAAQFATCDKDPQQKKFLTGLWLCVDTGLKAIACPAGLMKYENCQGEINTR
ncbi:ribonuclease T2 family protein [Paludibacterium purpuratum]|uniref:Ribonuclease I n=1 Tax=Paludibacterium purpuratum TaxID=1144873 RepID=A0A4V3DUE1_9NEIS|nr:hypothetical protein [Paludibacterium purpuratum]TDR72029.1 ribonuclease I [Paludibacterium purpuratum]